MRAALAGLLVALACHPVAGTAHARPRCEPAPPSVALELDMKPAEVSRARSMAELRREARKGPDAHQTGLYQVEIARRTEVEVSIAQSGDRLCVAVARVKVRVETPTRMIYVASEIDPTSCRYRVTAEHEHQHERIDEEILRVSLPARVEALSGKLAGLAAAAPASERDRAVRDVHDRAQATVRDLFVEVLAERQRMQLGIDTPQEYRRLANRCR